MRVLVKKKYFDICKKFAEESYPTHKHHYAKRNQFNKEKIIEQTYPIYSSKTVDINGRMVRLWDAAKNNMLENITIPTKQVKIYYVKK